MNADNERAEADASELVLAAVAIRATLGGEGDSNLADLLDPSATWGDCAGADEVLEFISAMVGAGAEIRGLDVEVVADRVVAEFRIGDGPAITQAIFIRSGRISEIVDATDREHARAVPPMGDLAQAASRSWRATRVSSVLPVSDLARAVAHYRKLGFDVRVYEGDAAYAFAARNDIELHLAQVRDLDPATNTSACYLYVDDADAVYASWRLADVEGRLTVPVDTGYGLREGAHVDRDGNLLRFGSGAHLGQDG